MIEQIFDVIILLLGCTLNGLVRIDVIMIIIEHNGMTTNKKFWVSSLIMGIYILLSYLITLPVIKVIIDFLILFVCCLFILGFNKKNLIKIVIPSFIIWVAMLLIDVLFSIIILGVLRFDLNSINNNYYAKVFITCCVCATLVAICSNGRVKNYLNKLAKIQLNFKNNYIFIIIILSVILFSISVYVCLFKYSMGIILATLFIMITVYTIIVIATVNEFNQRNRIQAEYDILLKNLNEYENLLDIQRVTNHENKNQLLVIKGILDKGENNASEYIDSIIDTQYKDNDTIIFKTNRIPSGGLRGLIYYKILTMKENRIESNLDVDRSLSDLDFNYISMKNNQELCKIVGVFLDNAIQAVNDLKKKKIDIYLKYENDELYIKVSNNYKGAIELDKIDNSGYTTKGKGHGYGLSLVKSIIRSNGNFINDREIRGKMFSQIIRLKVK